MDTASIECFRFERVNLSVSGNDLLPDTELEGDFPACYWVLIGTVVFNDRFPDIPDPLSRD